MRRKSRKDLAPQHLLRDSRVMKQTQLAVAVRVEIPQRSELVLVQPQALANGFENNPAYVGKPRIQPRLVLPKAGKHIVRQPDILLLVVLLAADFVALLYYTPFNTPYTRTQGRNGRGGREEDTL